MTYTARWLSHTFVLRLTLALIFITHSIPGMLDGSVSRFGTEYLNPAGFAPAGLYLAWAIKLSHVLCAAALLMNRYIKIAALLTVPVLVAGIGMVHAPEGWFVVGGGTNGAEYNVLLISVWMYLYFYNDEPRDQKKV